MHRQAARATAQLSSATHLRRRSLSRDLLLSRRPLRRSRSRDLERLRRSLRSFPLRLSLSSSRLRSSSRLSPLPPSGAGLRSLLPARSASFATWLAGSSLLAILLGPEALMLSHDGSSRSQAGAAGLWKRMAKRKTNTGPSARGMAGTNAGAGARWGGSRRLRPVPPPKGCQAPRQPVHLLHQCYSPTRVVDAF